MPDKRPAYFGTGQTGYTYNTGYAKQAAARSKVESLGIDLENARSAGETGDAGQLTRMANLDRGLSRAQAELDAADAVVATHEAKIAELTGPNMVSQNHLGQLRHADGRVTDQSGNPVTPSRTGGHTAADRALRALERSASLLTPGSADVIERIVRRDDIEARYVEAVANPDYFTAFRSMMLNGRDAQFGFTPGEREAVAATQRSMQERAMAEGVGSTGGFAVPIAIDGTWNLTNGGAINPIRELATVRQITTRELRTITTAGVVASYGAEASEVTDATPVLAQPTITAQRGTCFVPISFELLQDWTGAQSALTAGMIDAKAVLEAQAFLTGTGVNEPNGLLTGLTNTQRVLTATVAVTAIADIYALKAALPPRWQPTASFLLSDTVADIVYRMAGGGSAEPQLIPDRNTAAIIGKPSRTWSNLSSGTTTTGQTTALYGSWKDVFQIVERQGLTVELIDNMVGPNRLPTGQRGILAWWRNGSLTVNPSAARFLQTK